jgi:outer membrane protein OmpA-like peptidoglycan-associated protein
MIHKKLKLIALGAAPLAALSLGGCATTDYVNEKVASVQTQVTAHDHRIGALEGKVNQHEADLAKLANGKFNYQKVAEETVLFDTGSYQLKQEEVAKLDELVSRLKTEDKGVFIEIEGYADPRGGTKENRELSLHRARSVYDHLRDQGVALNRMMLFNQGEEHQLPDTGHTENRRVVVTVVQ